MHLFTVATAKTLLKEIHPSSLFKKPQRINKKTQYLKQMLHIVTPVLHFNKVFCVLTNFSMSEVLIKHTMTTVSIYYSKAAKYCNNYLKFQKCYRKTCLYLHEA